MTAPLPPVSRDRMCGRYCGQCPTCRSCRTIGPDCAGAGPIPAKAVRKTEKNALRRYLTDLLGHEPHDPLADPSDCQHGCNGACIEGGSDRCDFTCHTSEDRHNV